MEILQFDQTKAQLRFYGQDLAAKLNKTFNSISEELLTPNEQSGWNAKQIASHIYLVNQYLIRKIEKLNSLLHEGLLNEEGEYFESDLTIIETMLNVSVFKIQSLPEFKTPLYYSLEELELKLAVQFRKLIQLTKDSLAAYANNYLIEMKVIPGIRLDVYQLIYFGMKHADHHLNQIITLETINKTLNIKSSKKKSVSEPTFSYRL